MGDLDGLRVVSSFTANDHHHLRSSINFAEHKIKLGTLTAETETVKDNFKWAIQSQQNTSILETGFIWFTGYG